MGLEPRTARHCAAMMGLLHRIVWHCAVIGLEPETAQHCATIAWVWSPGWCDIAPLWRMGLGPRMAWYCATMCLEPRMARYCATMMGMEPRTARHCSTMGLRYDT
jgi:hypothetical protein